MVHKTSIRYFNNKPVRSRFDEDTLQWVVCAVDFIDAVVDTNNPRMYWYTLKRRNPELLSKCKQLKMKAKDSKVYNTDCLTNEGVDLVLLLIPTKNKLQIKEWIAGKNSPLDEQSKLKAYELFSSDIIDSIEVGTFKGLQQIHSFIFGGLFDFAGQRRTNTISKNGFVFANGDFLPQFLEQVENMPDSTFDEIVDKYVEMNVAHPFKEGNGRATRIWLDLMLKKNLSKCIDWSLIDKKDYFEAMEESVLDDTKIRYLLKNSLTDKINDREMFLKGIDYSYYYEEIE